MNLAGIDLNLLIVFNAVMRERNVTRAGLVIGLSQPAVSNALTRLRHHLKDDLFLRSPSGMKATPRALELADPIREILSKLECLLDPSEFDPATDTHSFRIFATEFFAAALLPDLADYLAEHAPYVDLRLLPMAGQELEALDKGTADFAFSILDVQPEQFESFVLLDDTYVVLMRSGHPLSKGAITLKRFSKYNHILVSTRGAAKGFVDTAMEAEGLTRRVAMTIAHFSAGPPLLSASDMVMTIPKRLAEVFADKHDLVIRKAPVTGPPEFSQVSLIWHKGLSVHPAQIWFRNAVADLYCTNVPN